jgi:hypothetical protein
MSINNQSVERAKEIIERGRENGRVLNVSEAFKMYPAEKEEHKGKIEYWTQGEERR